MDAGQSAGNHARSKEIIVRVFGVRLLKKTDGVAVTSIFTLQNKLWNELVELEHRHQAKYFKMLEESNSKIPALALEVSLMERQFINISVKKNIPTELSKAPNDEPQHAERLAKARSALRQVLNQTKNAIPTDLKELEDQRKRSALQLVKGSGLWWCHSEAVVARYETARILAMKAGRQLQFHKYTGEDTLRIRFTGKGTSIDKILQNKTTMLRFEAPTRAELGSMLEHKKDGGRRVVVTVRIGAKPATEEFPAIRLLMTIQEGRDFPSELPLKMVKLNRQVRQFRSEWTLGFTFSGTRPSPPVMIPERRVGGIQLGWTLLNADRRQQAALRVATVSLGPQSVEHLILPRLWLGRMEFADDLIAALDANAHSFWKKHAARVAVEVNELEPGWFVTVAKKLVSISAPSHRQVLAFAQASVRAGKPLSSHFSEELDAWYQAIRYRAQRAFDVRRRALENRNFIYRNFAAHIAKSCSVIALKDLDLRVLIEKDPPYGAGSDLVRIARRNRAWAGLSILRTYIEQAAARERAQVLLRPSINSTITCSRCGHLSKRAEDSSFECERCHTLWDKSINGAHALRIFAEGAQRQAI